MRFNVLHRECPRSRAAFALCLLVLVCACSASPTAMATRAPAPVTLQPTLLPLPSNTPVPTPAPSPTPALTAAPVPTPVPIAYEKIVRVTEGSVVSDGGVSRGAAWGDYDGDGYADLFVANTERGVNFLYHNNGDGTFTRILEGEIVALESSSESASWIDYDNDGDLDLFVANRYDEPNLLFRNDGSGAFGRVTEGEIVQEALSSTGNCWADYDNDGDLDVFISNRDGQDNSLFANDGEGSLIKVTSGEIVSDGGDSRACGWADVDGDGDLDLYVGNAQEANFFYLNRGDGTFDRVTTGALVADRSYTYGLSWADVDNDGDVDLFVANVNARNVLLMNDGRGEFAKVAGGSIVLDVEASKGNTWGDFDNDGDLDLYVANGTDQAVVRNSLYLNDGEGVFTRAEGDYVLDNKISAGTAWADHDNDGDLDIFVANWGTTGQGEGQNNSFYRNDDQANRWVEIVAVGSQSNRSAIGAVVRLKAQIHQREVWQTRQILGSTGYGSQNSLVLHFGLGDAAQVEVLEIRWPSGAVEVYREIDINKIYTVTEGAGITASRD